MRHDRLILVPPLVVALLATAGGCKKTPASPAPKPAAPSGQTQVADRTPPSVEIPPALANDPALVRAQAFLNLTRDLHNRVVQFRESLRDSDPVPTNPTKGD